MPLQTPVYVGSDAMNVDVTPILYTLGLVGLFPLIKKEGDRTRWDAITGVYSLVYMFILFLPNTPYTNYGLVTILCMLTLKLDVKFESTITEGWVSLWPLALVCIVMGIPNYITTGILILLMLHVFYREHRRKRELQKTKGTPPEKDGKRRQIYFRR